MKYTKVSDNDINVNSLNMSEFSTESNTSNNFINDLSKYIKSNDTIMTGGNNNINPIIDAFRQNEYEAVSFLIRNHHCLNINNGIDNQNGYTICHYVCKYINYLPKYQDILNALFNSEYFNVMKNKQDKDGNTIIHIALQNNNHQLCEILQNQGVLCNIKNNDGVVVVSDNDQNDNLLNDSLTPGLSHNYSNTSPFPSSFNNLNNSYNSNNSPQSKNFSQTSEFSNDSFNTKKSQNNFSSTSEFNTIENNQFKHLPANMDIFIKKNKYENSNNNNPISQINKMMKINKNLNSDNDSLRSTINNNDTNNLINMILNISKKKNNSYDNPNNDIKLTSEAFFSSDFENVKENSIDFDTHNFVDLIYEDLHKNKNNPQFDFSNDDKNQKINQTKNQTMNDDYDDENDDDENDDNDDDNQNHTIHDTEEFYKNYVSDAFKKPFTHNNFINNSSNINNKIMNGGKNKNYYTRQINLYSSIESLNGGSEFKLDNYDDDDDDYFTGNNTKYQQLKRQVDDIHERTIKKIQELMNVDLETAKIYKAALYQKAREKNDKASGLERAAEMEKMVTKDILKKIDVKKLGEEIKEHIQSKKNDKIHNKINNKNKNDKNKNDKNDKIKNDKIKNKKISELSETSDSSIDDKFINNQMTSESQNIY